MSFCLSYNSMRIIILNGKDNSSQTSLRTMKITLRVKSGKGTIRNLRMLLFIQILTLIAATVGALSYLSKHKDYQKGEVKGILYTGINSSTMIDNQVLEEGDTIYGITIEKINPKEVKFRKDEIVWSQRICELPNPAWNETDEK